MCRSSKRLVYPITRFSVCQQLFLLFLKHFELFIHQKQFLVTAQLGYHFLPALSTPFFIFLKNIQDPRMGELVHQIKADGWGRIQLLYGRRLMHGTEQQLAGWCWIPDSIRALIYCQSGKLTPSVFKQCPWWQQLAQISSTESAQASGQSCCSYPFSGWFVHISLSPVSAFCFIPITFFSHPPRRG